LGSALQGIEARGSSGRSGWLAWAVLTVPSQV
jgi:hypothetical protein